MINSQHIEGFQEYKQSVSAEIKTILDRTDVQPVLLVGTGLSRRYFSAPSWDELLQHMCEQCAALDKPFGYYRQTRSPLEMGQFLADAYQEAAWTMQTGEFGPYDHDAYQPPDIYLKYKVAEYIKSLTPDSIEDLDDQQIAPRMTMEQVQEEIRFLQAIQPHAIITTNYDQFLEIAFPDYHVSRGEEVYASEYWLMGEIMKIHGGVADPSSLVLTSQDYEQFNERRRYLSSKLLTYLVEHPVLIIGYGVGDPNVQQLFSWVAQALPEEQERLEDIYFVEWKRTIDEDTQLRREKQIITGDREFVTVKAITTDTWEWVFEAFASMGPNNIDMSLFRKLMATAYDVLCKQVADETTAFDYTRVERLANNEDELAALFGMVPDPEESVVEFDHHHPPADVVDAVGLDDRQHLTRLLDELADETGVEIRETNNRYHVAFFEREPAPRQYSDAAIDLLRRFNAGEEVVIDDIAVNQSRSDATL